MQAKTACPAKQVLMTLSRHRSLLEMILIECHASECVCSLSSCFTTSSRCYWESIAKDKGCQSPDAPACWLACRSLMDDSQ